jgi:hypothetical protein
LIFTHGSASVDILSGIGNKSNSEAEVNYWKKIKSIENTFPDNTSVAEQMMLKNPNLVFFGPKLLVKMMTNHYPCLITATSKVLFKVLSGFFNVDYL